VAATAAEVTAVTEHHPADDEMAPAQIEPDRPERAREDEGRTPPSDRSPGTPQHEPADPDDG
jgi:hypothetical protein